MNVRLTIRELVSFGRFPYSKGRLTEEDEQIVSQSLEYLHLTELQDRFLDELSGGQRQCAFIAMVIAQDTDYILLYEPLNNLDMKHSVQIMKILRRLVDELGKTVVIVLHDINFASVYSDWIVAMKDGRVVKDGPKEEEDSASKETGEKITIKHKYGEVAINKNPKKLVVFDFGILDTLDELGVNYESSR